MRLVYSVGSIVALDNGVSAGSAAIDVVAVEEVKFQLLQHEHQVCLAPALHVYVHCI